MKREIDYHVAVKSKPGKSNSGNILIRKALEKSRSSKLKRICGKATGTEFKPYIYKHMKKIIKMRNIPRETVKLRYRAGTSTKE